MRVAFFLALAASPAQAHTWGRISRPVIDPMKSCREGAPHPRLRQLAERLAAPYPEVFTGEMALEKFCFNVIDEQGFGASADPVTRELSFRLATLAQAQDDDQVASVLAHELSHILLQHSGGLVGNVRPSTLPFVLTDDPLYMSIRSQYVEIKDEKLLLEQEARDLKTERHQINGQLAGASVTERISLEERLRALAVLIPEVDARVATARAKFDVAYAAHAKREREIFPQETAIGWQEQEADEAGMELVIRAGFRPEAFIEALLMIVSPQEAKSCRDMLDRGEIPARVRGSLDTHPSPCWRAYNVRRLVER